MESTSRWFKVGFSEGTSQRTRNVCLGGKGRQPPPTPFWASPRSEMLIYETSVNMGRNRNFYSIDECTVQICTSEFLQGDSLAPNRKTPEDSAAREASDFRNMPEVTSASWAATSWCGYYETSRSIGYISCPVFTKSLVQILVRLLVILTGVFRDRPQKPPVNFPG